MNNNILNKKASIAVLDDLHNAVADHLKQNLDDPKILAQAIKFLKDNNITVEVMESNEMTTLSENIKTIANKEKESTMTVEMLLAIAEGNE